MSLFVSLESFVVITVNVVFFVSSWFTRVFLVVRTFDRIYFFFPVVLSPL
jgi:hypothetical protein